MSIPVGGTPSLKFMMPLPLGGVSTLNISFTQEGERLFVKHYEDCQIDRRKRIIKVRLTREETLSFKPNVDLHAQIDLKYSNGTVVPTMDVVIYVNDDRNKDLDI